YLASNKYSLPARVGMGLLPSSLFGMKKTSFSPKNSMVVGVTEQASPLCAKGAKLRQPAEAKQARASTAGMNPAARFKIGAIADSPILGGQAAHFLWPARGSAFDSAQRRWAF